MHPPARVHVARASPDVCGPWAAGMYKELEEGLAREMEELRVASSKRQSRTPAHTMMLSTPRAPLPSQRCVHR